MQRNIEHCTRKRIYSWKRINGRDIFAVLFNFEPPSYKFGDDYTQVSGIHLPSNTAVSLYDLIKMLGI